jgi:U3 small nucleolar RNA-associated protein 14
MLLLTLAALLLLLLQAKARKAGPEALAKFEEKLQAKMRAREMRKRTMRVG